jgi:hypothetical protein
MGISHRGDNIRATMQRAARDHAALADALATVEQFNARLATGKLAWFWPTIAAVLATKHHWMVIACDSCQTITELDSNDSHACPKFQLFTAGQHRQRVINVKERSHVPGANIDTMQRNLLEHFHGCERFSRPRPETVQCEFCFLSG